VQEERERDMCAQVNMKWAPKKVDARNMWVAKYGDIEKDIEAVDDAPEVMEKVEREYGREACK